MAKDDPHFRLRIPADLKDEIEAAAKENNRSINAEIVSRLEDVGRERRLLELALRMMETTQVTERQNLEVLRWMKDQMAAQANIIDAIAKTDGHLDEKLMQLMRDLVKTRGKAEDFPLSEADVERMGSMQRENNALADEIRSIRRDLGL